MNDNFTDIMGRLMFGTAYPYVNFLLSRKSTFQPEPVPTTPLPRGEAPRQDTSPSTHNARKDTWDNIEMQDYVPPVNNVSAYPYYWSNGMPIVNPMPYVDYGY